ncbi:hypothetical protein MBLNU459_g1951t1 [Dothideomycetes sp. NU459]
MGGPADEFPLLSALGLYAADIRGDGNCLFNALSDQLYGHQNEHSTIRSKVIEYMREHADYYKMFIDVHPGGGMRRNPKRKNVGAYSSPATIAPPSEADIDRVFQGHLASMARGGTYGDNMEISAFSSAFNVDVKIYQRDFAYMVSGASPDGDEARRVAHIAYHVWEHYSSIRNLDGPHTGPPHVTLKALSPQEEQNQKEKLASTPHVLPWMIDVVSSSLPYLADKPTIKRTLEECKGDINLAVDKLLGEENGSQSSAQESSSVEREQDSDEEYERGPSKKQDRRMSSRRRAKDADSSTNTMSKLATYDDSQESFLSNESSDTSSCADSLHAADVKPEEKNIKSEEKNIEPVVPLPRPTIRIKLNPPKPPTNAHTPKPAGKTQQKQQGPQRQTARDKKDIKKQAQKAARKERQQAAGATNPDATVKTGLSLRDQGMTATPPIESGFRTLFI